MMDDDMKSGMRIDSSFEPFGSHTGQTRTQMSEKGRK
jgi:hypothetical protein